MAGPHAGTPLTRRPIEPMDPAWWWSFPVYYAGLAVYGFTLTLHYLPSFVAVTGPLYARVFGFVILGVGLALVVACTWLSLIRQNPKAEAYLTCLLLAMLATHATYIVLATVFGFTTLEGLHPGDGDPPPMPQTYSIAVPVVFAVFPVFRLIAIFRSRKLGQPGWW